MKCISDVDMRGRVRMGSKSEILRFFNSGYAHDRNISIFPRRASRVTGNTLTKPKYASVRQSRDSLHRDTYKLTIQYNTIILFITRTRSSRTSNLRCGQSLGGRGCGRWLTGKRCEKKVRTLICIARLVYTSLTRCRH